MDKISHECLEIVLYVGLKDEEVAVKIPPSIVMGAVDPSSGVLEVLTIDLIHD